MDRKQSSFRRAPKWWHFHRWVVIFFHEHELRIIEDQLAQEQKRHDEYPRRMRHWNHWRCEKLGRLQTLRGEPGSVSYAGMVRRGKGA